MNKILLITIALITGCATTQPVQIVYLNREIPVAAPQPPDIERPYLSIYALKQDDTLEIKSEHYATTILQLLEYSRTLERALKAYKSDGSI